MKEKRAVAQRGRKVVPRVLPFRIRGRLKNALAVSLVLSLFLPGCWGRREVEERSFIHVMGVDKGSRERLRVTVAIAVPRTLRQGAEGSTAGKTSVILDGEGYDIVDALNSVEAISSREFTGQHITCLVLGEGLAKEDISPVIDVFHRSIEFRPTTLVVVCKGEARDFIRGLKAPEEMDIADYLTKVIDTGYTSLGYCPIMTLHDFSERYETSGVSPWAPLLALAAPIGDDGGDTGSSGPPEGQDDSALMPAAIVGTALFALEGVRYRMVGYLQTEETRAALLLAGKARSWYFDIQSPGDESLISILVRHSSVRPRIDRQGNKVAVHYVIRMSGGVEEYAVDPLAPPTSDQTRAAVAETASQRVGQLCQMSFDKMMKLGCDGIALGRSVQGTFSTMPEWEAFNWRSILPEVTATFDVKFDVYSTGLAFQRPFPR
jgi:spore germination protein KC